MFISEGVFRCEVGSSLDSQNTTVVDVTYRCNATCRYCQWGNKSNPRSFHRPLANILIPVQTLRGLGTQRIVLSGGEPRIHPELEEVIRYYRNLVDDVIIITNGYGLDGSELRRLLDCGATGVTVSLDSTNPIEAFATRQTTESLHAQVMSSLRLISKLPRPYEVGINAVVSHVTANTTTIRDLLEFGYSAGTDFVKFQPVFDDGYVSMSAPDLRLGQRDVQGLLGVADLLGRANHPPTNPPSFWRDLAVLARGDSLNPSSCGLGQRHSIATHGKINVCYWVDSASFGAPDVVLSQDQSRAVRADFEAAKLRCKVGYHCFCTQSLTHEWEVPASVG